MRKKLFERWPQNPLFTRDDWPYSVNTVFNPGATSAPNGYTLLLARVEDLRGVSHLCPLRSQDGKSHWQIEEEYRFLPRPKDFPEEAWGIEDPRVTHLEDRQEYAVLYTAYSQRGPLVSLALTKDFRSYERIGPITCPENKDAALFPKRIGGRYAMLHRPLTGGFGANIWISYSPDLRHWGDHREVISGRSGPFWDAGKIGLNAQPLECDDGWLICYHGVRNHCSGAIYRLGLAMLDREDPTRVLSRSDEWVFGPYEDYEMVGDVGGVVFPCGWILDEQSGELRLYYGAADSCIAMAYAPIEEVLKLLRANPLRC